VTLLLASRVFASAVPLEPDADEARGWLIDELAKPVYREAQPTLFDLAAQAIGDWLSSLFAGAGDAGGAIGLVVLLAIVAALVVVAFLVFGRPRLEGRRRGAAALFGDADVRDADQLRRAADAAARSGDHTTAIEEMFRALARSLDERGLVDLTPGTTAGGFARAAAAALPQEVQRLSAAGKDFDAVRYLGYQGTRERYEALVALDRDLRATVPAEAVR